MCKKCSVHWKTYTSVTDRQHRFPTTWRRQLLWIQTCQNQPLKTDLNFEAIKSDSTLNSLSYNLLFIGTFQRPENVASFLETDTVNQSVPGVGWSSDWVIRVISWQISYCMLNSYFSWCDSSTEFSLISCYWEPWRQCSVKWDNTS